jgi:hypothetical protein
MMIKELENVLLVLKDVPEKYQREAADSLAWFLKRVENEMTMTRGSWSGCGARRRVSCAKKSESFWTKTGRRRELLNRARVCGMPDQGDDFGERVAQLLRAGRRAQYDELQNFPANVLQSHDYVSCKSFGRCFPPDAQKKIAEGGEQPARNANAKQSPDVEPR